MSGAEVVGLLREIQRLTLDLLEEQDERALEDKQRRLEQLRWRLAAASRRAADRGLGDAA
jgi:hypothetical protein